MSPEHSFLELHAPPRTYTANDVLHWADFIGELHPHWTEFLIALACQEQAADRELEADGDRLQSMSEDFRYEHDITTAEETERWLEQRRVDLDSFTAWLERRYWRGVVEAPAGPTAVSFARADDQLQALFLTDAIFSDALDQLGKKFGRRLMAHHHPCAKTIPTVEDIEAVRRQFLEVHQFDDTAIAGWLEAIGRDPLWLEEMIALESAWRRNNSASN